MAKDLTSFRLTPPGSSSQATHLASVSNDGDTHLAVIRLASSWNNREFVLTPSEERFSCAVASAISSTYATAPDTPSHRSAIVADGLQISDTLASVWNAKTSESWASGHKAVCQYYARGFGPYACTFGSPSPPLQTIETGGTRVALKFNPRAFPVDKCSAFSASLRIYHPSYIWTDASNNDRIISIAYANECDLCFRLSRELEAPSAVLANPLGYIQFNSSFANRSHYSTSGISAYAEAYDIWNGNDRDGANGSWSSAKVNVFKGGSTASNKNTSAFYSDHPITGNNVGEPLQTLKSLLSAPFWLTLAFRHANGFGSNEQNAAMVSGVTRTLYASRAELVFTATAPSFN